MVVFVWLKNVLVEDDWNAAVLECASTSLLAKPIGSTDIVAWGNCSGNFFGTSSLTSDRGLFPAKGKSILPKRVHELTL